MTLMRRRIFTYAISELVPYINWLYFFHAWGINTRYSSISHIHGCDACKAGWLASFPERERAEAAQAMQLHKEATNMLAQLEGRYKAYGICRLCEANADGDNLLLDGISFPLLRQQSEKENGYYLCLSDFVAPKESGKRDCVGVFATCADNRIEQLYPNDPYLHMMAQTLADRLAEACTERMHQQVRLSFWGYAPDEQLSISQLHAEKFTGIRPAVGYPSLPDLSVNFLIDELLDIEEIGIRLTSHGAMQPHASVSGLMISHPQACYFTIGAISQQQLADYATRRNMPVEVLTTYLRPYLL